MYTSTEIRKIYVSVGNAIIFFSKCKSIQITNNNLRVVKTFTGG